MVNQAHQDFFSLKIIACLFEDSISEIFSATSPIDEDGCTKAFHQAQAERASLMSLSLDFIIAGRVCKSARWLTYELRSCSSWNALG